jgi:hypothetical protein
MRKGAREKDEAVIYLIYDDERDYKPTEAETTNRLESREAMIRRNGVEFADKVEKDSEDMMKQLYGEAYGHLFLSYFTVYSGERVEFELSADHLYTTEELAAILKFSEEAKETSAIWLGLRAFHYD